MNIIKKLHNDLYIIEIKTKLFEGRRLADQEDINSGKTLNLFMEENWDEIEGKRRK
jgi:hypothetical protein